MGLNYKSLIFLSSFCTMFFVNVAQALSVVEVKAPALFWEYSGNHVRANQKYHNYDYFLLSGKVKGIEPGWSKNTSEITLDIGGIFETVEVEMNTHKYSEFIASLNEYQTAIFLCPINEIRPSKYTVRLKSCEPGSVYESYLAQEKAKKLKEPVFNDIRTNETSNSVGFNITTAPDQLSKENLLPIKKLEKIITDGSEGKQSAKYYVIYEGPMENPMMIESVEIIVPSDILDGSSYTVYSAADKNILISNELKKIENLLNNKNISGAIKNVDVYLAKLLSQNLNSKNVLLLNNLAYYLEQNGYYVESAIILEEIVKQFPQRISARINLGDAYWGINKHYQDMAVEHYQVYIQLMEKNGRASKIPKRIYERIR